MKRLLLPLLAVTVAAHATDFPDRVREGKAAAASTAGKQYDESLGPVIGEAMRACISVGSTAESNLGAFTLVGEVSDSGAIFSVEVQPVTAVSKCFAKQFEKAHLPSPPRLSGTTTGFPITVEMKVVP